MIFDVVVLLVAVAAIGLVARRADKRVTEAVARMEGETVRRAAAIDKQGKVFVRKLEQSRRVGDKALGEARNAIADTRQLHYKMNEFISHPRIRRMMGERDG